jgi:hypothetical protein
MIILRNRKMKNIFKYILPTLILVMFMGSCDEKLNKLPPQSLSDEVALTSEENVLKVLEGTYAELGSGDLLGGNLLRNSELLAADDEVVFTGTYSTPAEIFAKAILTTNSDVRDVWLDGYSTINVTNNVLSAVSNGVIADSDDALVVEGEARFIRGLVYFELVRFFGLPYSAGNAATNLGVPIVLEPTNGISESSSIPRNTVQEVYTQAIADLNAAAAQLPAYNNEYANSVAAQAILARIYLQMGDYPNALAATNAALTAATDYGLVGSYGNAFNRGANSIEDIFSAQVTNTDGTNNMQTFYAASFYGGRGDIEVLTRHPGFYDPADLRLALHYIDPTTSDLRVGKWRDNNTNVGAFRMAELYLNRAECNFRISGASASVDADINMLRTRAGLGNIAVANLNQIFLERKLELAHEGHAIHDFKRTQGAFYTLDPGAGLVIATGDGLVDGFAYDADKLVYPIPDREIQANDMLKQNPGY